MQEQDETKNFCGKQSSVGHAFLASKLHSQLETNKQTNPTQFSVKTNFSYLPNNMAKNR